jgi:hypothetical protein
MGTVDDTTLCTDVWLFSPLAVMRMSLTVDVFVVVMDPIFFCAIWSSISSSGAAQTRTVWLSSAASPVKRPVFDTTNQDSKSKDASSVT